MVDTDRLALCRGEKQRLEQIFENRAVDKLVRIEAAVKWARLPFDDCHRLVLKKIEEILYG